MAEGGDSKQPPQQGEEGEEQQQQQQPMDVGEPSKGEKSKNSEGQNDADPTGFATADADPTGFAASSADPTGLKGAGADPTGFAASSADNNGEAADWERLKAEANDKFKAKKFAEAVELYDKAIEANPNSAVLFGNRSFAHLKLENYGYALSDANRALSLDKTYLKGYYRRGAAYIGLAKFKLAMRDYEVVHKALPNDRDAKAKYMESKKIYNEMVFLKAIRVDESVTSAFDNLNPASIAVEDAYDGPRLENETTVTLEFMLALMEHFKNQKHLHKRYACQILMDVKKFFEGQPSLVDVEIPEGNKFTVCGDIHGQYYDLLNIFDLNGKPSEDNPYLFNGDFVDRGSFSVECIFTLFGFKLLYPNHFFMSRGNHESENMNKMYGFDGEVRAKYSDAMVAAFTEVYNWLPLAHCFNSKVLVMHGGLFKEDGVTLDKIREVKRNCQPPDSGIMCDLLWSDPMPALGRSESKRGVGCQFGPDVTKAFLAMNNLDYVIRSHEVKENGYEVAHDGKCITVFSAPNYCDNMGNKGAFVKLTGGVDDMKPEFQTFDAVPHPNVKPMAYANSLLSLFG